MPRAETVDSNLSPEEAAGRDTVLQKIDLWKKRLLDLTRRNKLLYFSARKATIKITVPSVTELFKEIVNEGHQLSFSMLRNERQLILSDATGGPTEDDGRKRQEQEEETKPGDIETNLSARDLQSRLYRLRREWKTWQEEQGVHTLFLAFGILRWKEAEQEEEEYLAPLILVPVGLLKDSADKPYRVELVEEDIVVNPALLFKLRRDFGIELPEIAEDVSAEDVVAYFNGLAARVKVKGWSVQNEVWLGRFSFEKYVMYQDLENHREEAWRHPVIKALAGADSLAQPSDLPPLDQLDDAVSPQEVFPVLDADASQMEVLIRARGGQHLVVHGPPGTGKSQTIVNLIAQALRDGKKVLFVSEKMAALEVVHRRLRETKIAMGCLEVHSHHTDKGKVIQELGKALQQRLAADVGDGAGEQFKSLIRRRDALNKYVRELHKARGPLRLSAFQVHGKLARLLDAFPLEFKLPWSSVVGTSSEEIEGAIEAVGHLARAPEVVDMHGKHSWEGARVELSEYSLQCRDRIINACHAMHGVVAEIERRAETISKDLDLAAPSALNETEHLVKLLKLLAEPMMNAHQWLVFDAAEVAVRLQLSKKAQEHAVASRQLRQSILSQFSAGIFSLPAEELLERFQIQYRSIKRWLRPDYWRDRKTLRAVCSVRKVTTSLFLDGLAQVVQFHEHSHWFQEYESALEDRLGASYKTSEVDWDSVCNGLEWVGKVLALLPNGRATSRIAEYAKHPESLQARARAGLSEFQKLLEDLKPSRELVAGLFENSDAYGFQINRVSFSILREWLETKKESKDLDDWVAFLQAKVRCEQAGLSDFVAGVLKHGVKAHQLTTAFLKQTWKSWLSEAYRESSVLREFRGERHEDIIKEFRSLDRELRRVTVALVCEAIEQRQPKRTEAQSSESQVGILLREMQKRRRHKPLRRLFSEIPHLLQELKPCLLMSPLSVASYLTRGVFHFDVIIFDEASQIPPADAIGAILRGKQLLVAGDDKQLPPTRFFQADVDDYEEEESNSEPLESILNDCKALPGFIERPLTWHYRSRFEELITFSNRLFYGSELVTFPGPFPTGQSGAVRFVHVADGIYDRGGSRTNRTEAKRVVDLIVEHFRTHGGRYSVGVITLSFAQEEAVLEEWERRKTTERDLDAMALEREDEPLFIKALEKVQGDERDFIIMSIGYGKDEKGVLHLNFGPINQFGGERRLNVAVTRARFQTTVVSSILPHELDLARLSTGRDGVVKLQQYLEYAKNGGRFTESAPSQGTVELNDFEEAVKQALESRGLRVDGQVGCSGFRIDLAIRHPEHPGRYILGIECDGATYHSHRTARDRDRLRQEVLTRLGWKLHRIWSTDWIKAPEQIVNRVLSTFEELRASGRIGVQAPDEVEPKQRNADDPQIGSPGSSATYTVKSHTRRPPEYTPYLPAHRKQSDSLYGAEHRPGKMDTLVEDIKEVVAIESPVHPRVLMQRIGDLYGFERVGNKIEEIMSRGIEVAVREGKIFRSGGFLWKDKGQTVRAKTASSTGEPREIEHVAVEELADATEWVLDQEYGLPKEALVKEVAQLMGYDRTGENVRHRIEKAVSWLLKQARITVYGDQVVLTRNSARTKPSPSPT